LLRLLPADFRQAYGLPVAQAFLDLCADEWASRGRRGLISAWSRAVPDLIAGAVREWVARLGRERIARLGREWIARLGRASGDRPPLGARLAAAMLPIAGALLVVYSQIRYPANLTRVDYVLWYGVLLAGLGLLGALLLSARSARARPVACALGTAPGWLLAFHVARPGAGLLAVLPVIVLIATAAGRQTARTPTLAASTRTGALTGMLAGVVLLVINLADGLASMGSVAQDTVYVHEFVRTGQSSLAAYVLGERIGGGASGIVLGALLGAAIGLIMGAAGALAKRRTPPGLLHGRR
jgi:hypothetical protein